MRADHHQLQSRRVRRERGEVRGDARGERAGLRLWQGHACGRMARGEFQGEGAKKMNRSVRRVGHA